MTQLRRRYDELQDLNAEVIVISFGTTPLARKWLEEMDVPFPLLLDVDRAAYDAFQLDHSLLRSWGWKTWLEYAQLMLHGYRWRGIQGDSAQLGGDFIIDGDGIIQFAWRSRDPSDRPAIEDILECLKTIQSEVDEIESLLIGGEVMLKIVTSQPGWGVLMEEKE
ncbi:MAG: redoxin domain-containing protein [Anaerolineales bacterium]|nr:redoxin domain-containing protein [Anaerolineales bacterium]